jgi:hypothetical protein
VTDAERLPGAVADVALKAALAQWQREALAMTAVDDVTTELVRLRAARHHDCHT